MTENSLICGYPTHQGVGISNQKMAFLSVLLDAFENKLPLALPQISEMDQISQRYDAMPFSDIFSKDHI